MHLVPTKGQVLFQVLGIYNDKPRVYLQGVYVREEKLINRQLQRRMASVVLYIQQVQI